LLPQKKKYPQLQVSIEEQVVLFLFMNFVAIRMHPVCILVVLRKQIALKSS